MTGQRVPGGVVHNLPGDLRTALLANAVALEAWQDITPLARGWALRSHSKHGPDAAAWAR